MNTHSNNRAAYTLLVLGLFIGANHAYFGSLTQKIAHHFVLDTFYGPLTITEPVLVDLINSPAVQRLKKIQQYGTDYYTPRSVNFTRYDHSIGVFALLRKYNFSLKEQIAGLLHDVSHTVFSHVGDWFSGHGDGENSYQDDIHLWHLKKSGIEEIAHKHGYTLEDFNHKNPEYKGLEQKLPDLCLDRIEYNLQGGVRENMVTMDEVDAIIASLRFEDGQWFFTDAALAKKFAEIPLKMTRTTWTGPMSVLANRWSSQALRRAVELKLLTHDDIHFGIDEVVWEILCDADDSIIQDCITKIRTPHKHYTLGNRDDHHFVERPKFRGVDPLVQTADGLQRLSHIDAMYHEEYLSIRSLLAHGWHIKEHNIAEA